jgi:hypothetical protein
MSILCDAGGFLFWIFFFLAKEFSVPRNLGHESASRVISVTKTLVMQSQL